MAEEKKKVNKINIEMPEELAEGTYANLTIVSHNYAEFVLDFVRMYPNLPKAKVKSRIILTPYHAKRMLQALAENVKQYELKHGKIEEPDNTIIPPMSFNSPKGQA